MSDIKLVVLDMAGTTLKDDQNVAQAFHEAMKIQGYDIPFQKINPLMGFKKTEAIMMMLKEYETESERITTTLIDIIHEDFIEIMIEFYEHSSDICALPGVEETMEIIKSKGIKIGVDTGFSKQVAELIVKRLGWREKGLIDVYLNTNATLLKENKM
ncbi:MAG: HAD hydrolase-like protein, partial [Bacteroidetes bacterium]|nr:HAD hydrolase-like protein [Bacteroidota bacterium]